MKSVADPATVASLIARLRQLRPDTPRKWGSLTAGEMLCHLGDAAASVLAGDRDPGRPSRLLKWIALYSPLPWPKGLPTPAHVDPHKEGTKPTDFEQDRARAIAGLEALAAAPPAETVPSAPCPRGTGGTGPTGTRTII